MRRPWTTLGCSPWKKKKKMMKKEEEKEVSGTDS
jgi:hypothetical protein